MYMYFLVPGKTMENSVAVMVSSYMYCGSTFMYNVHCRYMYIHVQCMYNYNVSQIIVNSVY